MNTTAPYDGVRPLDFLDGQHTVRFEISASGSWTIEIIPLTSAPRVQVPGTYEGTGDEVLIIAGDPDKVTFSGNTSSRNFIVKAYGERIDLLINTTDPYEGTVLVKPDIVLLEVRAVGSWTMTIE